MWSGGYGDTLCFGCVSCLVTPLNALSVLLTIWVKSNKVSEGVLHKKRQSHRLPLVDEN